IPNSRQTSVMASPSSRRATKRRRSSITELAFHGIHTSRQKKAKSVTHVSGTKCHLCLGPLTGDAGSPRAIHGTKAPVLRAFFISGPIGRIGRRADFSPKGRFFSEPLDCADSVR